MPETHLTHTQLRMGDAPLEYWFREGCHITELWNQPMDPFMSVAKARVSARSRTRWHRLEGIVERYLLVSGQGRVQLGDGTDRRVQGGDAVLIPAGVSQRIENTGDTDLIFLAVCTPRFRPEAYQDVDARS